MPIDYYVTVDMQALVDMVDNFGGIAVYIPHDMSYGGSKLLKGYRNLNGASAAVSYTHLTAPVCPL